MEYLKMEKLGISPSMLGFGCMRFPLDAQGEIDEAAAQAMIDRAMAEGVTYYDTAWGYHGGKSEPFVGRALQKYDRSSFYLATKLPLWEVHEIGDVRRIFEEQLKRLQTDHVDFYLLHAVAAERWQMVKELGVLDQLVQLREEGKIKYIGFSFHDTYELYEEVINHFPWDFCQIQLNYMDIEEQAGSKGCALAKEKGIPVVVMEPVKGGSIARLPEDIEQHFKQLDPRVTAAGWAMRWVANQPGVHVVLSGMSNMEQLDDNLQTFSPLKPLTPREEQAVAAVREALNQRFRNACTGCRYCMPCPNGVNIPKNFAIWNEFGKYENVGLLQMQYYRAMPEGERASQCIACGACEPACPQHLRIIEDLSRMVQEIAPFAPKA